MDTDRDPYVFRADPPFESGTATEESGRAAARQRVRLRRALLAFASYILIGFYTIYLYFSDQLTLDTVALIAVNLAIIVWYCLYFWLITSGCNRYFWDPSLTWPQLMLAAALTMFLFAFGRTLFAQDLYFFAFMMTLLFSALRLDLKQILVTEPPAFGGFAAIVMLHHGLSTKAWQPPPNAG